MIWRRNTLMLNILWYFLIYAFIGWCIEVIYAAVKTGKFVNRGFLNGPYCPIYGVGVIIVIYLLDPVKNNVFYMFLGSIFIASTIELIGGFALEKIFHQKWWNYDDMPFNICGYICPMFSLVWGLACLIVVDRIHPVIFSLVNWIPQMVSKVLLIIFAFLFIIDLIATVKSILKLNKRLEIIDGITLKIRETSNNIGENIAMGAIDIVKKKDNLEESFDIKKEILKADLTEKKGEHKKALVHRKQALNDLHNANREILEATHFGEKRLLKAFSGLKSIEHKDALEKLRNSILNGLSAPKKTEISSEKDRTDVEK
ncbi:putative ABC transporter permease [Clostridium sp.]|uniref:putative ABC transporter permease n=1 Tax=Clostridium sp. TaxID=1506 RepID=UPI00262468B8|nr:putative ABC transporter permease [uncultured Clostridium sp.]